MKRILSLVLSLALLLTVFATVSFAEPADDGFVDGRFTETRSITVEIYNRNNGTDGSDQRVHWDQVDQRADARKVQRGCDLRVRRPLD